MSYDYAKSPQKSDPLRKIDPAAVEDFRQCEPALVKSGYLPDAFRSFLIAEGTGIFNDYDDPNWLATFLVNYSFLGSITIPMRMRIPIRRR